MPEISDKVKEELKTPTSDIKLEAKPSQRQEEFAKITEAIKVIQEDFLKDESMTMADAIKKLQAELTKMVPKEDADFEKVMSMRGPGLGSLGQPGG